MDPTIPIHHRPQESSWSTSEVVGTLSAGAAVLAGVVAAVAFFVFASHLVAILAVSCALVLAAFSVVTLFLKYDARDPVESTHDLINEVVFTGSPLSSLANSDESEPGKGELSGRVSPGGSEVTISLVAKDGAGELAPVPPHPPISEESRLRYLASLELELAKHVQELGEALDQRTTDVAQGMIDYVNTIKTFLLTPAAERSEADLDQYHKVWKSILESVAKRHKL